MGATTVITLASLSLRHFLPAWCTSGLRYGHNHNQVRTVHHMDKWFSFTGIIIPSFLWDTGIIILARWHPEKDKSERMDYQMGSGVKTLLQRVLLVDDQRRFDCVMAVDKSLVTNERITNQLITIRCKGDSNGIIKQTLSNVQTWPSNQSYLISGRPIHFSSAV